MDATATRRVTTGLVVATLLVAAAGVVTGAVRLSQTPAQAAEPRPGPVDAAVPEVAAPPDVTDVTDGAAVLDVAVDVAGHGLPHGTTDGLTMFRGNPTRSWYGRGPVPAAPSVAWQFPEGRQRLCSSSNDGRGARQWCGTGWTGQPAVWNRPDGVTEVVVGAYDRQIHFLDATTGLPTRPPFLTGDLVKGSVTLDPDGFPLLYSGSRDNRYRVIALDRDRPTELFALEPHPRAVWNNDWDGNGVVVDDLLLIGGEDSWFRVVELNRSTGDDGLVRVAPRVLAEVPGFDDQLFADLGDSNVSIEGSPLLVDDVVYVANSGGLVSGWNLSRVREGFLTRVFRYWLGDDADATLVAGPEGTIYAAVEAERGLPRSREVGQLVALDPSDPSDPLRWSVAVPARTSDDDGGIWATPAVHGDHLYITTHSGDLLVVDRHTGEVVHSERTGYHEWSSPVVVDDTLVLGLCELGGLRGYSLADPATPTPAWEVRVPSGACIESTPAVWEGGIYVGSRDGRIYGFTDPPTP